MKRRLARFAPAITRTRAVIHHDEDGFLLQSPTWVYSHARHDLRVDLGEVASDLRYNNSQRVNARLQLVSRLRQRSLGRESRNETPEPAPLAFLDGSWTRRVSDIRFGTPRKPQVCLPESIGTVKTRRCDPDHRKLSIPDFQHFPQDIWVTVEDVAPDPIADYDHRRPKWRLIIFIVEPTPELQTDSQNVSIVRSRKLSHDGIRDPVRTGGAYMKTMKPSHSAEGGYPPQDVCIVRVGERHTSARSIRVVLLKPDGR